MAGPEVPKSDAALTVTNSKAKVVIGRLWVAGDGKRGPADGGDERGEGERGIGIGGSGHWENRDQLHGADIDDGNTAAGTIGEKATAATVRATPVVAASGSREHAIPRLVRRPRGRHDSFTLRSNSLLLKESTICSAVCKRIEDGRI